MIVEFVSREQAKEFVGSQEFSELNLDFISISDTNSEKDKMKKLWKNNKQDSQAAIFFNFSDIDGIESGFTEKKARKIVEFCKESFAKKKDILVHCLAGISRSGAVAKFVNDYFGLNNEYLNNYTGHNLYVYYTLCEVAGMQTLRSYYKELED